VFAQVIFDLVRTVADASPKVPASVGYHAAKLFQSKPSGAGFETEAKIMPTGFREAIADMIAFVVWVENASYHEGFERGQSLLAGLASGNLNHADFEVKVLEEDRDNNRKIDELRKKNAAAPS
jgi:hypothetical protein